MVTSPETLEKIREAIKRHYSLISLRVLGDTPEESLLRVAYLHSFLTPPDSPNPPQNTQEARLLISHSDVVPQGEAVHYEMDSTRSHFKTLIDQMSANTTATVEGLVRQNNDAYKQNALQNLRRSDAEDRAVKKASLAALKGDLSGTAQKATSSFRRATLTELSNTIGNASVDRIIDNHAEAGTDSSEIFVYRIPVQDSATCRWCRRFYGDVGETPKMYRLSRLLGNGSNYGKPTAAWLPVVGATHPNTRTSQIIELPAGFIALPGGSMNFVGQEKSSAWLQEHLSV